MLPGAFAAILIYLVPIALLLWALYLIIRTGVKHGILLADQERARRLSAPPVPGRASVACTRGLSNPTQAPDAARSNKSPPNIGFPVTVCMVCLVAAGASGA